MISTPDDSSARGRVRSSRWQRVLWGVFATVFYFSAARLGLQLASVHGSVSPVWPATGVAIAVILVGGVPLWPCVWLGAFAANALTTVPLAVAGMIAVGNTLEALMGAWIVRTGTARWARLGGLAEPTALGVAALAAPLISASVGVAGLEWSDMANRSLGGTLWSTWWVGDALGALVVAPLMLAVRDTFRAREPLSGRNRLRLVSLLVLAGGACALVFFWQEGGAFLFTLFPVLLLATSWFGAIGGRLVALLISVAGVSAAYAGRGPFISGELNQNLLHLQVFLASVAAVALVLPAFRRKENVLLPVAVLLGGWTLSGWVFVLMHRDAVRRQEEFFGERVAEAQAALRVRMTNYTDALLGGTSFIAASKSIDRDEWRVYAESLQLKKRYPGINGLGIILAVPPDKIDAWRARVHVAGEPEPQILPFPNTPEQPGAPLYLISYLEGNVGDRAPIGRNVGTEPSRREAAEQSRDSGEPRIHHRVPGSRDTQRRSGLLLYVPFYAKEAPLDSMAQRREAHLGWVYAQVYPDLFLEGVLGPMGETLRLHFFEMGGINRDHLLYSSTGLGEDLPDFERMTEMEMAGQRFQLAWRRGPKFPPLDKSSAVWTASSCALATLLLAGLVMSLQSVGQRANAIAAERTAQLAASEERFRSAFDYAGTGVALADLHGRWLRVNRSLCEIFGYTEAELLAKTPRELTHPEDLASDLLQMTALVEGRVRFYQMEKRFFHREGRILWIRLTTSLVRDATGAPLHAIAHLEDITARREAAEAVQQSQQQFRRAFEDAGIGMALVGLDGRWLRVNRALCESVGYTEAELLRKTFQDITHPDDLAADLGHLNELLRGDRRSYQMEKRYFHRDGHIVWIKLTASLVRDAAGAPAHFVSQVEDITARKQLEADLHAARDAALEASRMKSEFLATMSHEIRTPMNAVVGMTSLIADTPLSAEQREMVQAIQGGAENLVTIINDILDFSRIEAGKLRLDPGDFELGAVIKETVALLAPRAYEKQLEFACEVTLSPPSLLLGDAGRVRQVLTNLIGNAIKFTERGKVFVTATVLRDSAERRKIRVAVRDTGIGVPVETQPRLFQPFTQADSSPTRRYGGSGLGLAISRQLVELMGGTIGFESEPGRGSNFWFELEFARRAMPAPPAANVSAQRQAGGLRLLLVEDNPANQAVARMVLGKLGHRVEVAPDGEVALARLSAQDYDAVFMDCQMPVLDGYEATRRIRSGKYPGINARIPIIALTAYAMREDRAKCLEAGMDDYLTKPIRPAELSAALQRCGFGGAGTAAIVPDSARAATTTKSVMGREGQTAVLDAEVLAMVQSLTDANGQPVVREVVAAYLRSEAGDLERIGELVESRSAEKLALKAHGIAGSAAAIGAMEVRGAALALESAAQRGDWSDVRALHAALRGACERLRGALAESSLGVG